MTRNVRQRDIMFTGLIGLFMKRTEIHE